MSQTQTHGQATPAPQEKLTAEEAQYRRLLEKEPPFRKTSNVGYQRNESSSSASSSASSTTSSTTAHSPQQQADEQLRIAAIRALRDSGVTCAEDATPDGIWKKMLSSHGRLTNAACLAIVHSLTRLKVHGIDVNARNEEGHTALYLAALKGQSAVVSSLISAPDIDVNTHNENGTTALHWAAAYGHSAVVHLLLCTSTIDVNARSKHGTTALHWAADYEHSEIVSLLLDVPGIDINAADENGNTALFFAVMKDHSAVVGALLRAPGVDVNARCNGHTALYAATIKNCSAVVSLLVKFPGVELNAKENHEGETALHLAVEGDNTELLRLLLDAPGLDVNVKNIYGTTALHRAVDRNSTKIVSSLLRTLGINVNARNNKGSTPIHRAARLGYFPLVNLLLSAPDIDINAKNRDGETLIDWAVKNGHAELPRPLLAAGALRPPLHIARGATTVALNDYIAQRKEAAMGFDPHALLSSALPSPASSPASLQHLALGVVQSTLLDAEYDSVSVAHVLARAAQTSHLLPIVPTLALASSLGHYKRNAQEPAIDDAIRTMLTQLKLWDTFLGFQEKFSTIRAHINCYLDDGSTLLTRAAKAGNLLLIKVLVQLGADLRLPDQHGDSALAAAAKTGQWPACAELLSLKANPNTSDAEGYPALFYMAQAFASASGETPENQALAHLIRHVRIQGHHFDHDVRNPDTSTMAQQPGINIADLLVSNAGQFGLYAPIIYGTNHAAADSALPAPTGSATTNASSSATTAHPK